MVDNWTVDEAMLLLESPLNRQGQRALRRSASYVMVASSRVLCKGLNKGTRVVQGVLCISQL